MKMQKILTQVTNLIHITENRLFDFGYGLVNSINPLHYMKVYKNAKDLADNSLETLHTVLHGLTANPDLVMRFRDNYDLNKKFNNPDTKVGRRTGLGIAAAIPIGAVANKIEHHDEEPSQPQMQNSNDATKLALGSAAVAGTAYGLHRLTNRREKRDDTTTR